jgi:hypothetical protein
MKGINEISGVLKFTQAGLRYSSMYCYNEIMKQSVGIIPSMPE